MSLTEESYKTLLEYPLTDAGNAESFKTLFGDRFCYVPQVGKWFKYDGVRWATNDEEALLNMLKTARMREKTAASSKDNDLRARVIKWSLASESSFRLKAALSLAESMLKVDYGKFDKDPYLLSCANGVVDLSTGEFRPSRPEDRLHRSTNVRYDPAAKFPIWSNFLWEIFNRDEGLIIFIGKAIGYTLTGDTSEQCLFISYGSGANAKSTFLGIIEDILGEYAITTPPGTLKIRRWDDAIPNDIARMAGARFVKCIEVKEGAVLNEERIKSLTGGDRIPARFLHKEFFEFTPAFKLWIAVNHKPIVRGTDTAIWRRIRLIPFEAYFPPERRDLNMKARLKGEISGILNWAIEGCLKWQKEGLAPPDKIKDATEEYRKESDQIGRFLDERTIQAPGQTVMARDLYNAYYAWCQSYAEFPVSGTAFGKEMSKRGFERVAKPQVHYKDIRII